MNSQTLAVTRQPNLLCGIAPPEASSLIKPLNNALQILRMKQLVERTKLSRATLYMLIASDPTFPRKILLSTRAVGWHESDVDAWLNRRPKA